MSFKGNIDKYDSGTITFQWSSWSISLMFKNSKWWVTVIDCVLKEINILIRSKKPAFTLCFGYTSHHYRMILTGRIESFKRKERKMTFYFIIDVVPGIVFSDKIQEAFLQLDKVMEIGKTTPDF